MKSILYARLHAPFVSPIFYSQNHIFFRRFTASHEIKANFPAKIIFLSEGLMQISKSKLMCQKKGVECMNQQEKKNY